MHPGIAPTSKHPKFGFTAAPIDPSKVNGKAKPKVEKITPAIIKVNGHGCFAPIAQSVGLPALVEATKEIGIGALTLTGIHHFAALWPETEYLADNGLVGIACTAYMPSVAPAGSKTALFGTNPISLLSQRAKLLNSFISSMEVIIFMTKLI